MFALNQVLIFYRVFVLNKCEEIISDWSYDMKFIKNFILVFISNISTLVSGILVGFLLPIILPIEDYGYYKTFTLYVTYLGLFSLGIVDGIVLKYGGFDYEKLDKPLFRSYFKWYLIIHVIITVLLSFTFLFLNYDFQRFILIMLIINMFSLNIVGFFRQISEITQKFKEYSIIKIIQSFLTIGSVVLIYIINIFSHTIVDYKLYMLLVIICNIIIMIWYIYLYRDLVFGNSCKLVDSFADIRSLMYYGAPLMFANLCSTLILVIDRQFVNVLFENKVYAIYAFAYNLLAMLTVVTSAVSTVLYPALKRTTKEAAEGKYSLLLSSSLILMYAVLVLFFPLSLIIKHFIPNYIDSIIIFRIIFPGLPLSCAVTVVIQNYYKMLGNSTSFFKKSLVILILSIIANGIAYCLFKNTVSISAASVLVTFIWFIYVGIGIYNKFNSELFKESAFSIICTILFYVFSSCKSWIIGMSGYLFSFCLLVFLMDRTILKHIKDNIKI